MYPIRGHNDHPQPSWLNDVLIGGSFTTGRGMQLRCVECIAVQIDLKSNLC